MAVDRTAGDCGTDEIETGRSVDSLCLLFAGGG